MVSHGNGRKVPLKPARNDYRLDPETARNGLALDLSQSETGADSTLTLNPSKGSVEPAKKQTMPLEGIRPNERAAHLTPVP